MSFASFSGSGSRQKKVALGGASKVELSREEVLERARLERERRSQQKLELRSATAIQAFLRGRYAVGIARSEVRRRWQQAYGVYGELADGAAFSVRSPYIRELCFFCQSMAAGDEERLANACRLMLQNIDPSTKSLVFCSGAALGVDQRNSILHMSKRLMRLCLGTLTTHRYVIGDQLGLPRQANAAYSQKLAPPLVEVLVVLSDPQTWQPALGPMAPQVAAELMGYLVRQGLFPSLSQILIAVTPEVPPQVSAPTTNRPPPAAEALVVNLTARCLTFMRQPSLAGVEQQLPYLLCVPLLWSRCPSLQTLAGRLWQHVTVALAESLPTVSALSSWLPHYLLWGKAGAAVSLLGNIVAVCGASLQRAEGGNAQQLQYPAQALALDLTHLVHRLLLLVPMRDLFQEDDGSRMMDDEQDSPRASIVASKVQLAWTASSNLPRQIAAQVSKLADAPMLRPLVRLVLPAADASAVKVPDGTAADGPVTPAPAVRALCQLLLALLEERGFQQGKDNVGITLTISGDLVQRLWFSHIRAAHLKGPEGFTPSGDETADPGWMLPLTVFCLGYSSQLAATPGDAEMYERQKPLPLAELYSMQGGRQVGVLSLLKFALWQALWVETAPSPGGWNPAAATLRSELKAALGKLLSDLYIRNCRRSFAPPEAFHVSSLPPERFHAEVSAASVGEGGLMEATHTRVWSLLENAPFLIPFQERARVFLRVVSVDRQNHRDREMVNMMQFGANRFVSIRRSQLLEDGFKEFNQAGDSLRARIRIQFINQYGEAEAGVDGGGLFKDFMESIVREGFDPDLGLFNATAENRLYPNPLAEEFVEDALQYLNFLGKMVGKTLYEGILVELPLARFVLKKLLGKKVDLNDLPSLDPELYRNLMFLREYDGNVEDLSLTFTINKNEKEGRANEDAMAVDKDEEVELVPGGRDKMVTNANRVEYTILVSKYRLDRDAMNKVCNAFRAGLLSVIQEQWLKMFNAEELQMLISGAGSGGLDLEDMQRHVQYAGGYHPEHPVIQHLWKALGSLTAEQQGQFLKFVTSCSRPPLLGFKYLEPPLCVQMAGSVLDASAQQRLPTASTCINMLKLPPYTTPELIRDKLLYAIKNISGFDLS